MHQPGHGVLHQPQPRQDRPGAAAAGGARTPRVCVRHQLPQGRPHLTDTHLRHRVPLRRLATGKLQLLFTLLLFLLLLFIYLELGLDFFELEVKMV